MEPNGEVLQWQVARVATEIINMLLKLASDRSTGDGEGYRITTDETPTNTEEIQEIAK